MRHIPVARCGVCPYVRPHNLLDKKYVCLAQDKDADNDITFAVMNSLISRDCRLPIGKPEDAAEETISDDDYLDEDDDTKES